MYEARIFHKKLALLYDELKKVIVTTFFVGALIFFGLRHYVETELLVLWFGSNIVVLLYRTFFLLRFRRDNTANKKSRYYFKHFYIGIILSASLWGAIPFIIMPEALEIQMFIIILLTGMTAGATGSSSAIYKVFVTYVVALLFPLFVWSLMKQEELYYMLAGVILFYIVIVTMTAKRSAQNLNYSLQLQEELAEAIALEKMANESKNSFLSSMSHEIRTPLNAIIGYINLLSKHETNRRKQEQFAIIKSSSTHLLGVINDILDFNKITTAKIELESIDIDIYEQIDLLAKMYEPLCKEHAVSLHVNRDTNLPRYISTDPLRLNQVLNNLLSNALKFSKKDTNIVLALMVKESRIHISVQDEGIGIAKEAQSNIFKTFEQADSSTSRKYGGSGLGLSISAKLVQLFGSELKVESSLDKGSTFSFDIALIESDAVENIHEDVDMRFNGESILLAEDNKTNQMLAKFLLEEHNLEVQFADDGKEACELYSDAFALVLMDINMPNMDGIEAMKRIKEKHNSAIIIALTANALSGDKETYINEGFDDYLSKPIDEEALLHLLKKYLNNKG